MVAIEVVQSGTGERLAYLEGYRAERLFEASGLLQNLAEVQQNNSVIVLPLSPGVFGGPGQFNYPAATNEEYSLIKEQLLLDLFNQTPVGKYNCYDQPILDPDFRALPEGLWIMVMQYLLLPDDSDIDEWWKFADADFEVRKETVVQALVTRFDTFNDEYMRNLNNVGTAYNSNSNNVVPHPNTRRPEMSLTQIRKKLMTALASCESVNEFIRQLQRSQNHVIEELRWVHDLYVYIRREYGHSGEPVPYYEMEQFLNDFIGSGANTGGRRRRKTRRNKKRKGTRRHGRSHKN